MLWAFRRCARFRWGCGKGTRASKPRPRGRASGPRGARTAFAPGLSDSESEWSGFMRVDRTSARVRTQALRNPFHFFKLIGHLPTTVRLYGRLLADPRVAWWPKLMLVGALIYVISPLDLIPDFA